MRASRSKYEFSYAKFLLLGSFLVNAPASAQSANPEVQSTLSPTPETGRPIEGEPRLTPEELEDRKLRAAYQQIHQLNTCSLEIIQRYDSEVIPLAEKSVYDVPKNKFLFIANLSIAGCYAAQHRWEQAEQRYKRIIVYAAVWPGADADYQYYFRLVGMAQMGAEHWKDAEESLNRSLAIIEPQIEKELRSEHEPDMARRVGSLLGGKAASLSCLALVYRHEGRAAESLETADLAYEAVTRPHFQVALDAMKQVLATGTSVAQESGDEVAIAKWSRRSKAGTAINSHPATPD